MSSNDQRLPASFRDPSGFMYRQNGKLYRQINLVCKDDYDFLMSSGLYQKLTQRKLLVPHVEVEEQPFFPDRCYKIIQPEEIRFISYPYEWSFSQLKDAALRTLVIQKEALYAEMTLKDASAYNMQFHNGVPVLIDTLSFAQYHEGDPWVAYRQFCQHFLVPLALMSYTDVRLSKLMQLYIDGIPLDLGSKLLPRSTRFNFGLLTHIHLHAQSQQRFSKTAEVEVAENSQRKVSISKLSLIGLIDSLESTVKKLTWKISKSDWADYYNATNYSDTAFDAKKKIVSDWLHELAPTSVWDLGANTGIFSLQAADLTDCLTISADIDPGAVEINYLQCKKNKTKNILPLVLDLTNPSAAIGWNNQERDSFYQRGPVDVVMALALIHHLAIANNVPLEKISTLMAALGQFLVIEFVPKDDSQVRRLLRSRDDIFDQYHLEGFVATFENDFVLRKQAPVSGSKRVMFLFEQKNL